jgi:hypothetical protein
VGDIDFWVISAVENSNKFQKNQVLEGKISWGRGNTWAKNTGHTSFSNATSLDQAIHFHSRHVKRHSQKFYFLIQQLSTMGATNFDILSNNVFFFSKINNFENNLITAKSIHVLEYMYGCIPYDKGNFNTCPVNNQLILKIPFPELKYFKKFLISLH